MFGKLLEIWLEKWLENWLEKCDGKFGWKCWLEMLGGKFGWKMLGGKVGWKKCWKNVLEIWMEMLGGHVGWKNWLGLLEMLVENLAGKFWLENLLVNGCEIIGGKIVATNPSLRLHTTFTPLGTCDQGVGADIAGQLLVEVAQKCPGNNFKERLSHLWKDIQKMHVEFQTPYKFQTLNPEGRNKGNKGKGPLTLKGTGSTSQIYGATTPCSHKQIFGHECCSQPCLPQACQTFGAGI